MPILIQVIVCVTAAGMAYQCLLNWRYRQVRFLSFPIAVLILFPYPLWLCQSWLSGNHSLFWISLVMGAPTLTLSWQYFRWEMKASEVWRVRANRQAVYLAVGGLFLATFEIIRSNPADGLALGGAYFTCVISLFSYLLKLWHVAKGRETLNGLSWLTLLSLLLFYMAMFEVGRQTAVSMLSFAYAFSIFACMAAVIYKSTLTLREKKS